MLEMWHSFTALPMWVKLWMMLILGPINMATLAYLDQPMGITIAALAWGGMLISVGILIRDRGFSKLVSGGHVLTWPPLVLLLIFARPDGSDSYGLFLTALLLVDAVSLIFDTNDLRLWFLNRRSS
ncbi:hypothetical protein SAMN06273572_1011070 [Monaibacterium marinum]|uniref:SPW repeat-containing protein n=1 Tax=Pontivivens marinum TaxID=1690039 RepID=A0A2C9CPT4_9RHOB|nr:hypothetical protein [Monaibacterium marinum]SOH93215.1 hypothetical protein SAMN06273572_1011070 [Monaibacterium marinum]